MDLLPRTCSLRLGLLLLVHLAAMAHGTFAQEKGATLSASFQQSGAPDVLFPGGTSSPRLEVALHPGDRQLWEGVQIRILARLGNEPATLEAMPVSLSATYSGAGKNPAITPNKWYYASYLGLGTNRSTITLVLRHRRSSGGPLELIAEVEAPGAEPARTAPLLIRCADLTLLDIRDPVRPEDDEVIRDGETAWLTHYQDSARAIPIMPRLIASTPGLSGDYTVQWRFHYRYRRRPSIDQGSFPAEGVLELPGDQSWKIFGTYHGRFFGGNCTLSCRVLAPEENVIFEGERQFQILSENPVDNLAIQHIKQRQGKYWYAWGIAQHESRQWKRVFNQFNASGRVAHEPNFGPPDGWGLFQIDSARGAKVATDEVWDWRTNAQAGLDELETAEQDSRNYLAAIKRTYPSTYENPPGHYQPPGCQTVLTAEEAAIIQCYNGAAIVRKLRNSYGTYSYYRSCWRFNPGAPSGQRWSFVKNRNNYVWKVVKHELEGDMASESE